MSRYVITGSTGFIGRNLVERLDSEMHTVLPFGRSNYPEDVAKANPDYIIHCAGETEDEEWMVESNVVLTDQLLDQARKCSNLKAFVTIGSSTEQGKKSDEPNTYFDPVDLYGATKGAATLISLAYARSYNVPACVIRPMSLYGKYDKIYHLIPKLYDAQFAPPHSVSVHPGVHDWMSIDDFVSGILTIARPGKCIGDVVNLGTGNFVSNQKVVRIMEELLNVDLPVSYKDTYLNSYDRGAWTCDPINAECEYGWKANISLVDGLRDYVAWRRSQPLPPF